MGAGLSMHRILIEFGWIYWDREKTTSKSMIERNGVSGELVLPIRVNIRRNLLVSGVRKLNTGLGLHSSWDHRACCLCECSCSQLRHNKTLDLILNSIRKHRKRHDTLICRRVGHFLQVLHESCRSTNFYEALLLFHSWRV